MDPAEEVLDLAARIAANGKLPPGEITCQERDIAGQVKQLSSLRQRELLEQFQASIEAGGDRHSPRARSWRDSLKEFFDGIGS